MHSAGSGMLPRLHSAGLVCSCLGTKNLWRDSKGKYGEHSYKVRWTVGPEDYEQQRGGVGIV